MELQTKLSALAGVGSRIRQSLEKLELRTVEDLINHFPFRYEDFSNTSSIAEAQIGESVTVKGQVWSIKNVYTRTGKVLTQAILNDGTNSIELVWFNQSWLPKNIHVGESLQVAGKITKNGSRMSLVMPKWEKIQLTADSLQQTASQITDLESSERLAVSGLHTGRLVAVYPETFGLTSKWLRAKVAEVLPRVRDELEETLPDQLRADMPKLAEAIEQVHFPTDWDKLNQARQRLAFDELFFIHLATQKTRQEWNQKELVDPLKINQSSIAKFIEKLPFKLTKAQLRVIDQISDDLKKDRPMNRLIQGEVGSGKTVVAAVIAYIVALNKLRTLIMAPTEILALQHYSTLTHLLEPFGLKVGLYTGRKKTVLSADSLQQTANKEKGGERLAVSRLQPDVIIGTHALVSKNFQTKDVGLIVIDEQQRFGVEQRAILRSLAKIPHFLTMTATPIPRTVALTMYGDLDISVIDELPVGRPKIKTFFVPAKKRQAAYEFIQKKIKEGDQAYIITPLIEESETLKSAKAAIVEHAFLQKKIFPKLKLGLLHGRLKGQDKEAAINTFRDKGVDILVSTSVVEVGVDVSNATIMMVEGAERFGLAQLHQFRGRVGRGTKESFCFLFAESEQSEVVRRLKSLERIDNGLELAELDLKIRGSGEVFGTRQSGRFNLKIASLSDLKLVEQTRNQAQILLASDPLLDKYPQIKAKLASLAGNTAPD